MKRSISLTVADLSDRAQVDLRRDLRVLGSVVDALRVVGQRDNDALFGVARHRVVVGATSFQFARRHLVATRRAHGLVGRTHDALEIIVGLVRIVASIAVLQQMRKHTLTTSSIGGGGARRGVQIDELLALLRGVGPQQHVSLRVLHECSGGVTIGRRHCVRREFVGRVLVVVVVCLCLRTSVFIASARIFKFLFT